MYPILVVGTGKIGASVAKLLCHSGDYKVTVADRDPDSLRRLSAKAAVETVVLDARKSSQLSQAMGGQRALLSACSFDINPAIAEVALHTGVSYFDLTEDIETTRLIRRQAENARAGQIFMPQCGLAPGFIGILARAKSRRFDRLDSIKMRVGALPQYPHNHMKYNLTWSTDGLINEYCNPCEAIHNGKKIEVLALEGLERFALDGIEYEAFNTSGGLGTLCETLEGRVDELNYKTVRYVGHQYLMDFLINGLKLGQDPARRGQLREILENALPVTWQDLVLVCCSASGWRGGHYVQETDARKIYHQTILGEHWSSIQLTTAAAACAVIDLHREGGLPGKGFVRQEQVDVGDFLANRFGQYYSTDSRHDEERTA